MSEEPTPTPKPVVRRAEQDQATANFITEALHRLETARDDPEIAPLIAARGYDAAKLQDGLELQQAAQGAFTARQSAIAVQKQAVAAADGAQATAQQTFDDFRETARAVFTAAADRSALSVTGSVPRDQQEFITTARAAYTAAQQEPYQAVLAVYGFPQAVIEAALATLDAFTAAIEAQRSAIGAATQATANRDTAVKELGAWVKQFSKIACVALKNRRDLLKKLGL